jgi:hypothetical protein
LSIEEVERELVCWFYSLFARQVVSRSLNSAVRGPLIRLVCRVKPSHLQEDIDLKFAQRSRKSKFSRFFYQQFGGLAGIASGAGKDKAHHMHGRPQYG